MKLRLTALLVAILFMFSAVACGGGGSNQPATQAATTTAAPSTTQAAADAVDDESVEDAAQDATETATTAAAQAATTAAATAAVSAGEAEPLGPFGKYDPPITISWAVSSKAVHQFKNGDTYEDNIWSRMFLDRLGIQLEVAFIADGASGAFDNKMNMQLAAGDLPDIIRGPGYQFFVQAYEAGYLADITDAFDEYASDYLRECDEKYPSFKAAASVDGRRFGIGSLYDTHADA